MQYMAHSLQGTQALLRILKDVSLTTVEQMIDNINIRCVTESRGQPLQW